MDRERFIRERARCPHSRLGHDGYEGAAGLLVLQRRAVFEEVEVGVEGAVRLGMARNHQRPRLLARRSPRFRGRRRR